MIGNKVCFFQALESTNDYMKKNISEFKDGDIICAKTQTNGRGRRSNSWLSLEGNLHFSYLLMNEKKTDISFEVIMLISSVLCNVLKKYGIKASIKYPNDIIVGKKKIGGILIERVMNESDYYVVGVGLNITTSDFVDLSDIATSIFLETEQDVDYRDVLWNIIKEYNFLIDCKHCNLYEMYKKRSIILGKSIMTEGDEYLVKGINLIGELVLIKEGIEYIKQLNEFTFKEYYNEQKN